MACMQYEQLGVPRVKVDRAVQYIDHNVIQLDFKNPDDHRVFQALARKHGIHYSRPLASPSRASTGATSSRRAVALTFADAADYDRAEVGQTWTLPDVKRELEDGSETITARVGDSGDEISLAHDFAPKERQLLIEGAGCCTTCGHLEVVMPSRSRSRTAPTAYASPPAPASR